MSIMEREVTRAELGESEATPFQERVRDLLGELGEDP